MLRPRRLGIGRAVCLIGLALPVISCQNTPTGPTTTTATTSIASLTLAHTAVPRGAATTATVTLSRPAAAAVNIQLASPAGTLTLPASVTIAPGEAAAVFDVRVPFETEPGTATITATVDGGTPAQATISITPVTIKSVTAAAQPVPDGSQVTGRIELDSPVALDIRIPLRVGSSTAITVNDTPVIVIPDVVIPANQQQSQFTFTVRRPIHGPLLVLTLTVPGFAFDIRVEPGSDRRVSALRVEPVAVFGGWPATGTVELAEPAGTEAVSVFLRANDRDVTLPNMVTVPPTQRTVTFPIRTHPPNDDVDVSIEATAAHVGGLPSWHLGTTAPLLLAPEPIARDDHFSARPGETLMLTRSAVLGNDTGGQTPQFPATLTVFPSPALGSLSDQANLIFRPKGAGVWTVGYEIERRLPANSASARALIVITIVNPEPSGPTAAADSYAATQGTTLSVSASEGVLANDGGTGLTAQQVSGPANGTLTLNQDGSFSYDPNPGFTGTDTFGYRATDSSGASSTATVTITVS